LRRITNGRLCLRRPVNCHSRPEEHGGLAVSDCRRQMPASETRDSFCGSRGVLNVIGGWLPARGSSDEQLASRFGHVYSPARSGRRSLLCSQPTAHRRQLEQLHRLILRPAGCVARTLTCWMPRHRQVRHWGEILLERAPKGRLTATISVTTRHDAPVCFSQPCEGAHQNFRQNGAAVGGVRLDTISSHLDPDSLRGPAITAGADA